MRAESILIVDKTNCTFGRIGYILPTKAKCWLMAKKILYLWVYSTHKSRELTNGRESQLYLWVYYTRKSTEQINGRENYGATSSTNATKASSLQIDQ